MNVGSPQTTWLERYQCLQSRFNLPERSSNAAAFYSVLLSTANCYTQKFKNTGFPDICNNLDFIDPLHTGYEVYRDYVPFPEISDNCEEQFANDLASMLQQRDVDQHQVNLQFVSLLKES